MAGSNDKTALIVFGVVGVVVLMVLPRAKKTFAVAEIANTSKVEFGKVDVKGNNFKITFKIINPSSRQIVVESLAGDVIINGMKSGIIYAVGKQVIKPTAFDTITATVKMQALPAVLNLLNELENKTKGYTIQFIGNVNVDGILRPVNIGYHFYS